MLQKALLPLLLLFVPFYWLGFFLDRRMRWPRRERYSVPVISIGNLTVGGTGKTPLLIRLAADLLKAGRRPGVLSRGYRGLRQGQAPGDVVPPRTSLPADRLNDENELVLFRVPDTALGIGADRRSNGRALVLGGYADCLLLDDGFQHWDIGRELDIVCIDATDPWGGSLLLPAGRLRETAGGLRRAGLTVITRSDLVSPERLDQIRRHAHAKGAGRVIACRFVSRLETPGGDTAPFDSLSGQSVLAVSGIGHPAAFESALAKAGARVQPLRFPDHHAYRASDLERVIRSAEGKLIVTTEKDWMKLRRLSGGASAPGNLRIVRIDAEFSPEDEQTWTTAIRQALMKEKAA